MFFVKCSPYWTLKKKEDEEKQHFLMLGLLRPNPHSKHQDGDCLSFMYSLCLNRISEGPEHMCHDPQRRTSWHCCIISTLPL